MYQLPIDTAVLKTVGEHQYYLFPAPATHSNYAGRPTRYANEKDLKVYKGPGSNGSALLHPDVMGPAELFMSALFDYGWAIDDWSMSSAVIQSGYRPDDENQGSNYLRIIKETIGDNAEFANVEFPADLEKEAQGVLGWPGDPRLVAFEQHIAGSPGWTPALARLLLYKVHMVYGPRGANPHATGFVFDLNFTIFLNGKEVPVGANPKLNAAALRNAVGMWINRHSKTFCFDSYDTAWEIWHMEYRGSCART